MVALHPRHDSPREGARLVTFTVLHYVLHFGYGVAVVSAIHGVAREPRLAIAVAFGFVIIEIALGRVAPASKRIAPA